MELHPDDRPATAEDFRQFLIGTRELPPRPQGQTRPQNSLRQLIKGKTEQIFLWVLGGLLVISLVASLIP